MGKENLDPSGKAPELELSQDIREAMAAAGLVPVPPSAFVFNTPAPAPALTSPPPVRRARVRRGLDGAFNDVDGGESDSDAEMGPL